MSILPDSVVSVREVTEADMEQPSAPRQLGARPASSESAIAAIVDPPAEPDGLWATSAAGAPATGCDG